MALVRFSCSEVGRALQIVTGLSLIYIGVFEFRWTDGLYLAAVGFVPLGTGLANVCVFAPLFGCDFHGNVRTIGLVQRATAMAVRLGPNRTGSLTTGPLPGGGLTPPTA